MIKRKTVETIEEYNEKGELIRKTVTETTEDDSSEPTPSYPWWWNQPTTAPYTPPYVTYCNTNVTPPIDNLVMKATDKSAYSKSDAEGNDAKNWTL